YTEVAGLAADLRAAGPGVPEREIHDRMLAHGSPPVRLLRALTLRHLLYDTVLRNTR
ncbi:MAG: hypothetical protein JO242_16220, partial [Streptosporangiaceae bacterium]|nr:hypothetical protein [Streptosporangiaceae bacterium]